jgi:hypothetical protein
MFKAFAKTTKSTLNVIVFSFFKRAINKIILNKRLGAIISQNLFLKSNLYKIKALKGPVTEYSVQQCAARHAHVAPA